jgi:hypothetical protein
MITPNLVSWQWTNYASAHHDRRNLLLHALSSPLFVVGLISIVVGIATASLTRAALGGALAALALAAQGRGHRLESTPPLPFRSPLDAVARLVVEQLITFPRFVLSGRFARSWRCARHDAGGSD